MNRTIMAALACATIAGTLGTPAVEAQTYYLRQKLAGMTPQAGATPSPSGSKCGAFTLNMAVNGNAGLTYFLGNRTIDATDMANAKAICEGTGKTFAYCSIIAFPQAACTNQGIVTNGRSCLAAKIVTSGSPYSYNDPAAALAACG